MSGEDSYGELMMESFDYEGIWWLPESVDNKVAGRLQFSKTEGLILNLIGTLNPTFGFNETNKYPLVHGLTQTGKSFTLQNVFETGLHIGLPGFNSQTLDATIAFSGAHFDSLDQIKFDMMHVEYNHLGKWVDTSGLSYSIFDEDGNFERLEANYAYPEEVTAYLTDVKITPTYTFNINIPAMHPVEELQLKQKIYLKVEADNALSLETAMRRFILPFRNLLTFATNSPNFITKLTGFFSNNQGTKSDESTESSINIFFQENNSSTVSKASPLFTLKDVKNDFSDLLQKWFTIADELDSVCNLFFGVLYSDQMYSEHKFASFVHAAESYHRHRFKNEVLPKAEHKQMVKEIVDQVLEKHQAWLKEKLAYSNETRFRDRIRDLIDFAGAVIDPLIGDKEDFVSSVANTRNYNTHYDIRLKDRALRDADLYWLSQTLSFLVQICLLRELGFSAERCVDIFANNQEYLYAIRRIQQAR